MTTLIVLGCVAGLASIAFLARRRSRQWYMDSSYLDRRKLTQTRVHSAQWTDEGGAHGEADR